MAESQTAGKKRPSPESESASNTLQDHAHKKRKVQRHVQHVQHKPAHIEEAPQDPVFTQSQLLKSISAALAMAGFDNAKPTALEMFRGAVEEYMLRFLRYVRISMRTARRTSPTALDFASALALLPNTSSASLLSPQLGLQLAESISYPAVPDPLDLPPTPPTNFSALLAPLLLPQQPSHIPHHFPELPPQHAWRRTPVFPPREHDARKMREQATEEGILAEQALRKLAAAAKTGALKAERRKEGTLSGEGKKRAGKGRRSIDSVYRDMMKDVQGESGSGSVEADEMDLELSLDGASELRENERVDLGMPEGVIVNWDTAAWRHGGARTVLRS